MWLVLDIGNSSIKGGLFESDRLVRTFQMQSVPNASVSSYRHTLHHHLQDETIQRIGLASVVPELTSKLVQALRQDVMVLPEVIHADLSLPFEMGYKTPETLGTDRLAAATAAYMLYGRAEDGTARPVIVIDAGTAVTYEVIDADGVYRGGAIAPGPDLLRRSLSNGTGQLPHIDITSRPRTIGRSTRQALQSGIVLGFIDGARGMLNRIQRRLGKHAHPYIVATGGAGVLLAEQIRAIDKHHPDLVLEGIYRLLELN